MNAQAKSVINESVNRKMASFAQKYFAILKPFYSRYSIASSLEGEALALFWSAFGPAAQYCLDDPRYAYAYPKP